MHALPHIAARVAAGCLAGWSSINLLAAARSLGYDLNLWWIDTRFLPVGLGEATIALAAVLMAAWAVRPPMSPTRRAATVGVTLLLGAIALGNGVVVIRLIARGDVAAGVPVPLSLVVAVALAGIACMMWRKPPCAARAVRDRAARAIWAMGVAVALALALPLCQMMLFGKTDYRRAADAIVVLGCRAYADGTPSDALRDRVATAAALYHDGFAPLLVMSGGPGDGAIDEPSAMKRYAVSLGVPADAIVTDPAGLNTAATAANARRLLLRHGVRRTLVVSHFYHLPRVKLSFESRGLPACTVPAEEQYPLSQLPRNMAREVAAWWWYYLQAV